MSCNSRYIFGSEHEEPLNDAQRAFEDYLEDAGYRLGAGSLPVVDGELSGGIEAHDLVGDFIADHPEFEEQQAEIETLAYEIGLLARPEPLDADDDLPTAGDGLTTLPD